MLKRFADEISRGHRLLRAVPEQAPPLARTPECDVCMCVFSALCPRMQPFILPACGHSVCRACYTRFMTPTGVCVCPIDRTASPTVLRDFKPIESLDDHARPAPEIRQGQTQEMEVREPNQSLPENGVFILRINTHLGMLSLCVYVSYDCVLVNFTGMYQWAIW